MKRLLVAGAAAQLSVQVVVARALVQLGAIKEAEDGGAAQDGRSGKG